MDRQIRRLGAALLVLFLFLFGSVNYIQVIRASRIADNRANAFRQLVAEYKIDRGSILATDGKTVLAFSKKSKGELKFERHYPDGPLYAGITGYYSIVYQRTELEAAYQDYLSADDSILLTRTFADQIMGKPKKGATIIATIDPELQRVACDQIADLPNGGAVVAMDPTTGYILAMCSNPTYDPNSLSAQDPKADTRAWNAFNRDPDKPLLSRANDELYPPGSTFKMVTAAAALENGYGPDSLWPNPPALSLPLTTHQLHNFGQETCPGGSQISLATAFRVSCNVVFGGIGLKLGPEKLAEQARAFGFGADSTSRDVPFDIPFQEGVFPDASAFDQNPAGVAFSAIGQFDVSANPMQMALVASAIANGGVEMRPRLVREIRDPQGQVLETFAPEEYSRPISPQTAIDLQTMMVDVVENGTGTYAQIPGVTVAGKTGTAEHGEGELPHAWFVSFAPAERPQVAVAVIVLDGGNLGSEATGGHIAAPIAKAVMEAALGR